MKVAGGFVATMRQPAFASLLLLSGAAAFITPSGTAAMPPRMSEVQVMTPAEQSVLSEYDRQTAHLPAQSRPLSKTAVPAHIPEDFRPWWLRGQSAAIGDSGPRQRLSLDELYARALEHSQQIRVFAGLPVIRETGIQEAAGAFDTTSYLQSKFERTNDPVGSTLTTGGADRFLQNEWSTEAGLKKRLITGTEVSIGQEVGRTDNNSIYFVPDPQTRAKLTLSVTQPLLKGAGIAYNRSTMQIARLDSEAAMHEFLRQSESHLLEIARTYWALYAARVTYLQKQKLIDETARVADELKGREGVDAQQTQLFRAQSALASRRSDLVREEAAIRNGQDRLRALTSDPTLLAAANGEIIPVDRLVLSAVPGDAREAAYSALRHRPEIAQAFLQLRASAIREKVAHNELLPELNLVLQGSLGGLDDSYFSGYERQYTTGGPGYSAGFVFSIPLENNEARARYERRQLEQRQQVAQVKTTIDTVLLEVKVSAREVSTAYRETQAKYEAVRAFTEDLTNLQARRDVRALQDQSQISIYLDQLIDAQDRRANSEEEFIRAAANYQVAIVNLERAKGSLLSYENVSVVRTRDAKGLPTITLQKGAGEGKALR